MDQHRCRHSQLCMPVYHMPLAQSLSSCKPMLSRDIPNGPWQEVTANYFTHKGREYLLVYNLFIKYPFIYKVSTKSAQSLCLHLHEITSQYGPPSLFYMDNGPPIASDELTQLLQHHHIDHITSCPNFPRSNSFIQHQVCTVKTVLSTSQDSRKTLGDLLLDLYSTPIGPNMSSSREILHNRTLQHPSRPRAPVNMESVKTYLLSRKQSQKAQCDRAHGTHELQKLGLGEEVLFRSPHDDEYIPKTIVDKATMLHSYIIEAQGKCYCRDQGTSKANSHQPPKPCNSSATTHHA